VGKERCWELQRLRKNGKRWEAFKWFTTFRQALDEAVHREIRLHPARNLADAIEGVSEIVRRVSDLIPPGYR
jgi:oligoendopeptidase F